MNNPLKRKKRVKVSTPKKKDSVKQIITDEKIQLRAYEIYTERGSAPDQDMNNWLQAEKELHTQ